MAAIRVRLSMCVVSKVRETRGCRWKIRGPQSAALENRQVGAPWFDRLGVLARHHANDLTNVFQVPSVAGVRLSTGNASPNRNSIASSQKALAVGYQ